jgi:hypothetical protein
MLARAESRRLADLGGMIDVHGARQNGIQAGARASVAGHKYRVPRASRMQRLTGMVMH